jgi:hypothetical protein
MPGSIVAFKVLHAIRLWCIVPYLRSGARSGLLPVLYSHFASWGLVVTIHQALLPSACRADRADGSARLDRKEAGSYADEPAQRCQP